MKDRRGYIYLPLSIVDKSPAVASEMFTFLRCVPLWMDIQLSRARIKYELISPLFDVVDEGCCLPSYILTVESDDNGMNKFAIKKLNAQCDMRFCREPFFRSNKKVLPSEKG
jgi:hypothetical protein